MIGGGEIEHMKEKGEESIKWCAGRWAKCGEKR